VDSSSPVTPGDVVLKKYRVERLLGMGAMGIVAEATHLALDQRVAIKFMLPGRDTGGEQHARFIREARASVRLTSPHVTRVFDVGALDSGAPYMVMELLNGKDLDAVLKQRGPLPFDEAAELILQACEALAEAHAIGIVHRDVKPSNLFLTKAKDGTPCVKVIDFGISKPSHEALKLTQKEEILGSPLYMSPEQMRSSADVDARSDVWSLGATLYELVAGVPPFDARGIQELCAKVWFEPPTPLVTHRPDARILRAGRRAVPREGPRPTLAERGRVRCGARAPCTAARRGICWPCGGRPRRAGRAGAAGDRAVAARGSALWKHPLPREHGARVAPQAPAPKPKSNTYDE
jgi:serine/threonine protein kinase